MKKLTFEILGLSMLLAQVIGCAAVVAGLCGALAQPGLWRWYQWVILAPALYLVWLVLLLALSALICWQLGARYPKPRYAAVDLALGRSTKEAAKLFAAATFYRRMVIVQHLPLVSALRSISRFDTLLLRAYSPSVHIGKDVFNFGVLWDPDLTELGDHVVIGADASISAHGLTTRGDRTIVYVSAPVVVGARVTIGGRALITMGCTIGAGAVIEPGAVLTPFTAVPAGEIWGGNPARPLRMRDLSAALTPRSMEAASEPVVAPPSAAMVAVAGRGGGPSPAIEEIRRLVIEALQIDAADAPAELDANNCAAWDSLGQVAIAGTLFDRFGIAVDAERVFTLRTLADIADLCGSIRQDAAPGAIVSEAATSVPAVGLVLPPRRDGLPDDLEMLPLMDSLQATRLLSAQFEGVPVAGQPLRVVVAATFMAQPIASAMRIWGRAFGLDVECLFAEYGQIVQALLDPTGLFATNATGVNVILARPEDFMSPPEAAIARLDQVLDALESFASHSRTGAQLLVGSLPPVVSSATILPAERVEALRARWRSRLQTLSSVDVLEFSGVVERLGIEQARDSSSEARTRAPYSPRLYQNLGIALVRRIRAPLRPPAKVIAVDCDNTLWGGVLGEVELEGLELGPDGPGRSFQIFQQYLKDLNNKGLLIVVVSRNEEHDVRQVFERHPGMILRSDDVTAWRVNWRFKSENLRDLADALGLSLDAFVFLDDDAAVRAEVATRLPEVHVVPLEGDPSSYCDTLSRLWLFDGAQSTSVDANRTRMMREEDLRGQVRRSAGSLEEYLADLQLSVEVATPADEEWPRIAQLTQRTNQFNLSLKRRTLPQLRSLDRDSCLLALKARDRFGDYGLVGAAILGPVRQSDTLALDTFLISCRALGRGVDDAFLHGIALAAVSRGARLLVAPYVEGPRNGQVRDFLARGGFSETTLNVWQRSLASLPDLPAHVRFELSDHDETSRSDVEPASGKYTSHRVSRTRCRK